MVYHMVAGVGESHSAPTKPVQVVKNEAELTVLKNQPCMAVKCSDWTDN